mmetsp:Transcript_10529/g.19820  ORF Transcript_10529/g.19820 Transcript_10529/m.19820 type:complete len:88 (+) Transcript_10529:511-774(+)
MMSYKKSHEGIGMILKQRFSLIISYTTCYDTLCYWHFKSISMSVFCMLCLRVVCKFKFENHFSFRVTDQPAQSSNFNHSLMLLNDQP